VRGRSGVTRLIDSGQFLFDPSIVTVERAQSRTSYFSAATIPANTLDYEIRSGVPVAAILANSSDAPLGLGTYDIDRVTSLPETHASESIVVACKPIGWSGSGNPSGATQRLFSRNAVQSQISSGLYRLFSTILLTTSVAPTDGVPNTILVGANGSTHFHTAGTEAIKSGASTLSMTGTVLCGSSASGTQAIHSEITGVVFDFIPTNDQYLQIRAELLELFT
jgi:hypothetical protein